ncbi:MAG: dUTP diphosphatase [Planctomycetes bacterium]|nr:dUTP diphosphatase [Planctomycetota bacterium]
MDVPEVTVPIKRLPGTEDLPFPEYATEHSVAMDLGAAVEQTVCIPPGAVRVVPTGIAIALPIGFEAQIRPRSGLAAKHAIGVINSPGTIDSDYRGEIRVSLINLGTEPFEVRRGMRIAQMLVVPVPRTVWQVVAELPPTERGAGGFGHTGV